MIESRGTLRSIVELMLCGWSGFGRKRTSSNGLEVPSNPRTNVTTQGKSPPHATNGQSVGMRRSEPLIGVNSWWSLSSANSIPKIGEVWIVRASVIVRSAKRSLISLSSDSKSVSVMTSRYEIGTNLSRLCRQDDIVSGTHLGRQRHQSGVGSFA